MTELVAVVRIRGWAVTPWFIQDTLEMLRLKRRFSAMIYPKNKALEGMLKLVSPYITWGELNDEGLKLLLSKLKTVNGEKVNDEYITKVLKINGYNEFVKKIKDGEVKLSKLDDYFKLPITLHPPKGGFKGKVNRPYGSMGEFGYRGEKINELIKRMV
ncbi:50S ribosomal protein L30 [Stygiolobus caldivivus]|uniref:Large ribosomal subunit protein uL30 n=1 Tax=Stygiolobus caldivivus TaxID=2824673 RepID=A0A8D5U823_9CREN|nr:50S ribosomal protein L30 [Stygiolobus caldivivus]BCU70658.1 50S ribosomal protein L30 [Stygiolobus caldivivus]